MVPGWVGLELDLADFDETPYLPYVDLAAAAGVTLTTYAALGDSALHRRMLFGLNRTCSADIPDRGPFLSFEEYVEQRIEAPTIDHDGIVVALEGDEWVGFSTTSIRPGGYAFTEMTGLLRSHRGRGLSIPVKLAAIRFARCSGMPVLRTVQHPGNADAIAMNRRLGFVDASW